MKPIETACENTKDDSISTACEVIDPLTKSTTSNLDHHFTPDRLAHIHEALERVNSGLYLTDDQVSSRLEALITAKS